MTKETKRKGYSTQQAQNEANKRYYHASEENRQRRLYIQAKSTAKNFILKRAKLDDLKELEKQIQEKIKKIEENS